MVEKDSFDHVVKTTAQWESQSFEYWIIPRGVLCVELTPDKKTKIKIGEGNKIYSQLPYINSETDLSDYYTKEEIDNILAMLNFVAIPSSEIYPTKEALPQTGNRQGDLRFVLNTTGDPYSYLWFNNNWIQVGGDLSEYAKKSEVNPRLNALELKAHTHVNKNVLDRLTTNVIDDSHKHTNKNILDATTASYTTQDKATLNALAAITVFEGATRTEDGTMGYVPAPLHGQHTYFLKGDGTWAYLDPGDKYKAGEGIYILSGEVTTQTFPFKLYAKGGYVKQYIIYGAPGGVGEWNATTQTYHIPIRVSAEGHTSIDTVIQVRDKLYEGDWINFETQEYSVYRTNLTSRFQNLIAIEEMSGIDTAGNFNKPPGYWPQFALSDYYEIDPDAKYEIPELDDWSYSYANVNMYDANKNRTRTILRSRTSKVQIIPLLGEKYIRIAGWVTIDYGHDSEHRFRDPLIYQLKDTISPVPSPLQQIQLIPNAINTIDVLTTNKPLDVYMETYIPEEPDPEDPLSGYSGIIYNDGVLDVTQEDPNNLNELTVHFRENVEKTLTIPSASVMEGATPSTDGEEGLVPAPLAGDQGKFLRGDGTWSKVKSGGDKYKSGEGIYILSGEIATDTFPFQVYSRSAKLKQYVIYGAQGGVGTLISSNPNVYSIPLTITSPDYGTRQTNILISDPLYAGDYIDYQRQVFVHTRTVLPTSEFPVDPDRAYRQGVYADGTIGFYYPGGGYADNPVVSLAYALESGASYEFPPGSSNFPDWQWNALGGALNVNLYDADMNRTRTVGTSFNNATIVTPTASEKYMIFGGIKGDNMSMAFPRITKLKDVEEPCVLQEVILYANTINTIDVDTSVKPSEMYVEVDDPPEDQPDDPLSNYTGIIYNDGVLDITQEDPNALNELTVHFRDDVDKTITIPSNPLEPATTTTLGGVIVGQGVTVDQDGEISVDVYTEGDAIEFQQAYMPITTSMKYVRWTITAKRGNDQVIQASEFEVYDESDYKITLSDAVGSMTGGTPSYQHYGVTPMQLIDGNTGTKMRCINFTTNLTITFTIQTPIASNLIKKYRYFTADETNADPITWTIQLSPDGETWYNVDQRIGENITTSRNTATDFYTITKPSVPGGKSINVKYGNGLSLDGDGALTVTGGGGGGTEYAAGDGIQIDPGTSVIDITSIQWQQGKINDADGTEAISGVDPYLDCEMFEITSHTSMVTLSGTYDNNIMLLWKPYYYDENDDYISTVNTWSTYEDGVQIPINAKYVRFVLTEDETTTLDPNDLAHVEIEYPLEVGKDVITNTGVIDIQVRDRKLIITKHNTIEEIPIPDPPVATTSTPGIVTVGQDLTIDQNGVLNIADINRMILNVEE